MTFSCTTGERAWRCFQQRQPLERESPLTGRLLNSTSGRAQGGRASFRVRGEKARSSYLRHDEQGVQETLPKQSELRQGAGTDGGGFMNV